MDISTIIGLTVATICVASAIIMGGSPLVFVNIPALFVVIGGTIGVVFTRFPLQTVFGSVGVVKNSFFCKSDNPIEIIGTIITKARDAKKKGLISLEDPNIKNSFMKKGFQLAADGNSIQVIKAIMSFEIASV